MDGYFRLGMVNQHKHLLKPGDQCIGGGYYHFDFVSNRILLDRESYDFGRPAGNIKSAFYLSRHANRLFV